MELHNFQFFTIETVIIQTVMLLVILWVLNKFIFKPYVEFLDKEAEKRKKLEDDYRNIDKLVADAKEEKNNILSEARNKSGGIISDAESLGNKKRASIIDKAEQDAKTILEASKNEIEKERLSMLNGVKSKLIDLILRFNSKLFKDEKVSREYIEKELGTIK